VIHNNKRSARSRCSFSSLLVCGLLSSILIGCGGGSDSSSGASAASSGLPSATLPGTGSSNMQTVRVAWAPTSDTDIAGYYIAHGTAPGLRSDYVWAGNVTTHDIQVSGSQVHYFAVRVLDNNGNESPESAEVSVAVP